MFGKAAQKKHVGEREHFRWRGEEISRIEGLSDAVFAFAVTLLIVSLEVPKTFDELIVTLKGFGAFAACFAQLMFVWYQQYLYYRRYNLQEPTSIVLTMTLLFFVLFYTYPLKFVFTAWLAPDNPHGPAPLTRISDVSTTFTIYSVGFITVFLVFTALYMHAYRRREELKLTTIEIWDTKHSIREMLLSVLIGSLSVLLANTLPDNLIGLSGACYMLMGPVFAFHGSWSGKRRDLLVEQHERAIRAIAEEAANEDAADPAVLISGL